MFAKNKKGKVIISHHDYDKWKELRDQGVTTKEEHEQICRIMLFGQIKKDKPLIKSLRKRLKTMGR